MGLLAALGAGGLAQAQAPPVGPMCQDIRTLEQAAQQDFRPVLGRERKWLKWMSLGPKAYEATVLLPEAKDCFIAAGKGAGRRDYVCLWSAKAPAFAAPDYARRVAACLEAPLRQSDFSLDLIVISAAQVSFLIGPDSAWDHNQVRLRITAP